MQSRPVPRASLVACYLIVLAGLAAAANGGPERVLGFVPSDPWRLAGATWLTAMVVHASLPHALANVVVLGVWAPDLERSLGSSRFLVVLGAATVTALGVHAVTDPDPTVPVVGASGAATAVAVAMAGVLLLRARTWAERLLALVPGAMVIATLAVDVAMLGAQTTVGTTTSASGHLGGAAFGLLAAAWAVRRGRVPGQRVASSPPVQVC